MSLWKDCQRCVKQDGLGYNLVLFVVSRRIASSGWIEIGIIGMSKLSVSLLGGFEARLDGRPLQDFQTDKVRALFCFLLVENQKAHHREYLAGFLWPDQEENRARHNLRQALSTLRKLLGDPQSVQPILLVTQDTIQINPSLPYSLDVQELITLSNANASHRHESTENCLPCLQRMQRICEIYRGDFLENTPVTYSDLFDEWILLKKEYLSRIMADALGNLAGYHIRRGEWSQARELLHRQLELDPWREEAHRLLMELYAQEGQRSAALVQFQRCRTVLMNELAIEPTVETIRLQHAIQTEAFLPGSRFPLPLHNLQSNPSPFVGRQKELHHIAELLATPDSRLITLTGTGGIGKTRLAHQAGRQQIGLFQDGVYLAELAGARTCSQAMDIIANMLGIPIQPDQPIETQLLSVIKNKEMLLILDNFEQLLECSQFLADLLVSTPRVKLIVTSREKLFLQEEWCLAMDGLGFPKDIESVEARSEAETFDSVRLFIQRAAQVQSQFSLSSENHEPILQICRLVEGNPLGLEMAAAAVNEQPCNQIASDLAHNLKQLVHRYRNVPERHRSSRAAFEYSWSRLSNAEQIQLASLAVFQGGFTFESAQAVSGADQGILGSFISKSLLRLDVSERYWQHEMIRQFARDHLQEDLRREKEILSQHCAHYAGWIRNHAQSLTRPGAAEMLERMRIEMPNIITAWNWAVDNEEYEAIAAFLSAVPDYFLLRGPVPEGANLVQAALNQLDKAPSCPGELLARIRLENARLSGAQALFDTALEEAEKAALEPALHDEAVFLQAQLLHQRGEHDAARPLLEENLERARKAGNQPLEIKILRELGTMAVRESNDELAHRHLEPALQLCQQFNDLRGQAAVLNNLGVQEYCTGQYGSARSYLNQAMDCYQSLGDLRGEAKAAVNLANLEADLGNYPSSLALYQRALEFFKQANNPSARAGGVMNLGMVYCELGDYPRAQKHIAEAIEIFRTINNSQAEGEALANLALLEYLKGNLPRAVQYARQAVQLSERSDDRDNIANALTYLGKALLAMQSLEEAKRHFEQARTIRMETPHPHRTAEIQAELAFIDHLEGSKAEAARKIQPVLDALQNSPRLEGSEDPYRVYWICYQILREANAELASSVLRQGSDLLQREAGKIAEPQLRQSFLQNRSSRKTLLDLADKTVSLPS